MGVPCNRYAENCREYPNVDKRLEADVTFAAGSRRSLRDVLRSAVRARRTLRQSHMSPLGLTTQFRLALHQLLTRFLVPPIPARPSFLEVGYVPP
jgi:hypothetical protein